MSVDPIKDGVNWYNYCDGNPISYVDPWGEEVQNAPPPGVKEAEGYFTYSQNLYETIHYAGLEKERRKNPLAPWDWFMKGITEGDWGDYMLATKMYSERQKVSMADPSTVAKLYEEGKISEYTYYMYLSNYFVNAFGQEGVAEAGKVDHQLLLDTIIETAHANISTNKPKYYTCMITALTVLQKLGFDISALAPNGNVNQSVNKVFDRLTQLEIDNPQNVFSVEKGEEVAQYVKDGYVVLAIRKSMVIKGEKASAHIAIVVSDSSGNTVNLLVGGGGLLDWQMGLAPLPNKKKYGKDHVIDRVSYHFNVTKFGDPAKPTYFVYKIK